MISYFFLAGAIFFEVCGTLLLPITQNFSRVFPTCVMVACYLIAFYCLTFAVREIPVAVVYGIWSGLGILLVAIFSAIVYKQILEPTSIIGLILIVIGVGLVNFSSAGGTN